MKELHKSCRKEDGTDDHKKGTQLLEVYAIEIQMYTETKNNKKLKVRVLKFYLNQRICDIVFSVQSYVRPCLSMILIILPMVKLWKRFEMEI